MRSNEEFDDPVCKLAHDLNSKLAVVLGCCDLLGDEVEAGSECARRLGMIRQAAQDMARAIRLRSCRPTENQIVRVVRDPESLRVNRHGPGRVNPFAEPPGRG
jgi:hypothetical protein